MITEDIELAKEIFDVIQSGIRVEFDSLEYKAEIYSGFMEEDLVTKIGEVATYAAITDAEAAKLYRLIKQLKKNAMARGDNWSGFVITYREGGQVNFKFNYDNRSDEERLGY